MVVFLLQCTEEEADKLGVRGWCKNTPQGTVQGQIEGPETQVQSMYVGRYSIDSIHLFRLVIFDALSCFLLLIR